MKWILQFYKYRASNPLTEALSYSLKNLSFPLIVFLIFSPGQQFSLKDFASFFLFLLEQKTEKKKKKKTMIKFGNVTKSLV